MRNTKLVIGGSIANCVHVAGVSNFLKIAKLSGLDTKLLGAAIPLEKLDREISVRKPDFVAVSYRLTPENAREVVKQLITLSNKYSEVNWMFAGTEEVVTVAKSEGLEAQYFVGEEDFSIIQNTISRMMGEDAPGISEHHTINGFDDLLENGPNNGKEPILRHHFGLPSLTDTINGVREIADARVVDVISLATDQNAQEFFFDAKNMNVSLDGAGGVPVRTPSDLKQIYNASLTGNFPKLRVYAGTRNLIDWAKMSIDCIKQAWGTVPLTWYSELDGRSSRKLVDAISENQSIMRYYAKAGLPIEVNEAHHWSLRDAPDSVAVAMAYIAALNAKEAGVKKFFAQYMLNTPLFTSQMNDIAKMQAKIELIDELVDTHFTHFKQIRAGLTHFSRNLNMAKGQLAQATNTALLLKPDILHVVGFCEASHAARPTDVIESCEIVKGVIKNHTKGTLTYNNINGYEERKNSLKHDAELIINKIIQLGELMNLSKPLTNPFVLSKAINIGILDAPHLAGQSCAKGQVQTINADGACCSYDFDREKYINEKSRLDKIVLSKC